MHEHAENYLMNAASCKCIGRIEKMHNSIASFFTFQLKKKRILKDKNKQKWCWESETYPTIIDTSHNLMSVYAPDVDKYWKWHDLNVSKSTTTTGNLSTENSLIFPSHKPLQSMFQFSQSERLQYFQANVISQS